jgi:hypothetical protein
LDVTVTYRQKDFDGVGTITGSSSISIRMGDDRAPVVAKGHFQVTQRVVLPEIKLFWHH